MINDNPVYLLAVFCLWLQARQWERPLAAIIGDVSPPIVDVLFEALAARLVPQCIHEICKIYDRQRHPHQPPKHFANEDLRVVAILVRARGTKRG
jgi:hypothetical protein